MNTAQAASAKTGSLALPVLTTPEQSGLLFNRERQARQYIGFLDFNRLQGLRIKSQGLQYCRRDLRGCHRSLHHAGVQLRVRDDQANVSVAETETAVLGIFLFRAGVDGAIYRLHDDIGCAAVACGVVELELQLRPGHDLIDEQRIGISVQVSRNRGSLALVL